MGSDFRVRPALFSPLSSVGWEPPVSACTVHSFGFKWQKHRLKLVKAQKKRNSWTWGERALVFLLLLVLLLSSLHSHSSLCLLVTKWLLATPNWHPYRSCPAEREDIVAHLLPWTSWDPGWLALPFTRELVFGAERCSPLIGHLDHVSIPNTAPPSLSCLLLSPAHTPFPSQTSKFFSVSCGKRFPFFWTSFLNN